MRSDANTVEAGVTPAWFVDSPADTAATTGSPQNIDSFNCEKTIN